MSKFKKAVIFTVAVLGLGSIAKAYNTNTHQKMAMEQCGSQDNIKRVDSKGFDCVGDNEAF